jgi:hypothetical protein
MLVSRTVLVDVQALKVFFLKVSSKVFSKVLRTPVAACAHADLVSVDGRRKRRSSLHFFSAAASTFLQSGVSLSLSLARQAMMRPIVHVSIRGFMMAGLLAS